MNEEAALRRLEALFRYGYGTGLTLLAFGFFFYASFWHDYTAHPGSERVIDTVLGFLLGMALSAVVQYFYGSSAGSKTKSDVISKALEEKTS